ncbi:MAG: PAS domain S-box protein [Proteobacteria bacterium]|nr:MAG: PAS domain S-box protein [Pseudomonadota bacterium]
MTANLPGIVYQFKIDAAGKSSFPYVSPAIKRIFGIDAADVVADPDVWLDIIHPDDRSSIFATTEESHRTLAPWFWEGRKVRASGEVGWFRRSSIPRKQDDGSVLWTGLEFDITEQKRERKR